MDSLLLWSAAAVGVLAFCVHTFRGGRVVARPLLADRSLPLASKWLNYYCWHVATVTLLFVAFGFAVAAWSREHEALAAFGTALAIVLSILSATVAIRAKIHPLRFPSTWLLGLMGIIGALGLVAGR